MGKNTKTLLQSIVCSSVIWAFFVLFLSLVNKAVSISTGALLGMCFGLAIIEGTRLINLTRLFTVIAFAFGGALISFGMDLIQSTREGGNGFARAAIASGFGAIYGTVHGLTRIGLREQIKKDGSKDET
jgi:hypothetical protein